MHILETYALNTGLKIDKPEILEEPINGFSEQNYIVINTYSSATSKNYAKWQEVIDLIYPKLLQNNVSIIQLDNGYKKYKFCKKINNISFNQSAFLIKNCCYLIGIDSFCMHLASIYNKKMLILFGGHHYFNCCKPYFGDYNNYRFMIADLKNKKPTFSKTLGSEYMNQFDPIIIAEEFSKHFFENENDFNNSK